MAEFSGRPVLRASGAVSAVLAVTVSLLVVPAVVPAAPGAPASRATASPAASPPAPTQLGVSSTAPSAQGAPMPTTATAESGTAEGPAQIAAPELPVRFVPGTTITTPVTVVNTSGTTWPSSLQVSYRWTEVGDPADLTTPGDRNYAPLGKALAPGESTTVSLAVRAPINSDRGAKRLSYDFYLDLWDGASWWSTTHPPVQTNERPPLLCGMVTRGLLCPERLVEDPTSDQLGLEKFLTYAGEETGAGSQLLTNLYAGNVVWSYDAFQNPSLGPSTFVRLAYNSMDRSDAGTGYGWSLQASTLTRLGTALSVPSGNATAKTMTFVDGDGTTHIYKLDETASTASLLVYRRPAGVPLQLTRDFSRPRESQWVFTRPDGVRFYYSQDTGLPTSVVDRNGNTLAFAHDGEGNLVAITDASGRTTLTLGWSGRHLRWVRDISGRGLRFTYTDSDQLATLEDGGGFDSVAQTYASGAPVKKFTFAYTAEPVNKNAKLSAVTDPRGATSGLVYYAPTETPTYALWPKRFTDRGGFGTRFAYTDPDGSAALDLVAEVTDENGTTPSVTTYRMDGFGRTTSIRDANANAAGSAASTKLGWDADHNVIRLEEPNGAVSTWVFDQQTGYPLRVRDAEAVRTNGAATVLTYARLTGAPGQPTVLTSLTSAEGRTSTFTHDAKGNLASVTDGLGNQTRYVYDANGTLTTAADAKGAVTQYSAYDPNGMPQTIVDAGGGTTRFLYDPRGNVMRVTDALSRVTTAAYDAFGRATSISQPHQGTTVRTTARQYDLNDNMTAETDPTGARTSTSYGARDEAVKVDLPPNNVTNRSITYTYDPLGRLLTEVSPLGVATTGDSGDRLTAYTYDRIGQVLTVRTPYLEDGTVKNPTTSYSYDSVGNVVRVVDPNKFVTPADDHWSTMAYDHNHRLVSRTDAAGSTTRTEYDRDGLVTAEVDALGKRKTYAYDAAGRLTSVSVPHTPTGEATQTRTTTIEYDAVGNRTKVTSPGGNTTQSLYDAMGRLVESRSPFDPADPVYNKPSRTFFEYDVVGQLRRQSEPTWATTGQAWTSYSYHASGDIAQSTDPWGITTTYAYDRDGRQTGRTVYNNEGTGARSMSWSYYPDGSLKSRTDGESVWEMTVDNSDSGFSATGSYTDNGDTLVSTPSWDYEYRRMTGGGRFTWSFSVAKPGTYSVYAPCHGDRDFPSYSSSASESNHTWECGEGYQNTTWRPFDITVERAGTVTVTLDGSESAVTADWVTLEPVDVPTDYRSFEYDYDANGQRTQARSLVDGSLRNRWQIVSDDLGRTRKVEEFNGAEPTPRRSTAYTYDLSGNMLSSFAQRPASANTNQAAARYTEYTWDPRDLISTVRSGSSPTDSLKTTTFTYDARAMRASTTKPNGNETTFRYYDDGHPKATVERTRAGALVASHDLWFNRDGHRSKDVSSLDDAGSTGLLDQTATYTYTPSGQLAGVDKTGEDAGKDETYRYDAAANIVKQTIGAEVTDMLYERNRLAETRTGGSTLVHRYDGFGRASTVTRNGTVVKRYTYDGFDRLVKDEQFLTDGSPDVTKTTAYDAFDRTVAETRTLRAGAPKTTRYVYLGLSEQVATEEQQNAAGAWSISKSYVYGAGGEKIAMVDSPVGGSTPATYYYGTNPHGDVETLTDATSGETRSTYRYQAYGSPDEVGTTGLDKITHNQQEDADVVNPYRFNGKRLDPVTGKYDMGFRDFDPGLNRYLTRDMYNGALNDMALGFDPWNANRYAFAGGNPMTGVELDGHMAIDGGGGGAGSTYDSTPAEPDVDDDNDGGGGCYIGPMCAVNNAASDAMSSFNDAVSDVSGAVTDFAGSTVEDVVTAPGDFFEGTAKMLGGSLIGLGSLNCVPGTMSASCAAGARGAETAREGQEQAGPATITLMSLLLPIKGTGPLASQLTTRVAVGRTTTRLQSHVDQATADYASGVIAMSPRQARAAARNPGLEEAFRGQVIDKAVKNAVRNDPKLSHLWVSRSGEYGPDFHDIGTGTWWDVTTPGQWGRHVDQYSFPFGSGIGLFTR